MKETLTMRETFIVLLLVLLSTTQALDAKNVDQRLPISDNRHFRGIPVTGKLPGEFQKLGVFQLGTHKLSEVVASYGAGKIFRTGGEGSSKAVCYRTTTDARAIAVIFESGALGGWETLTAISVAPLIAVRDGERRCACTEKLPSSLAGIGQLLLGKSPAEIHAAVGVNPSFESKNAVEYNFQSVVTPKGGKPTYDILSGIFLGVTEEKISSIQVYKVEAY